MGRPVEGINKQGGCRGRSRGAEGGALPEHGPVGAPAVRDREEMITASRRPRSRATSSDSTPRPLAGGEDGGEVRGPERPGLSSAAIAGGWIPHKAVRVWVRRRVVLRAWRSPARSSICLGHRRHRQRRYAEGLGRRHPTTTSSRRPTRRAPPPRRAVPALAPAAAPRRRLLRQDPRRSGAAVGAGQVRGARAQYRSPRRRPASHRGRSSAASAMRRGSAPRPGRPAT